MGAAVRAKEKSMEAEHGSKNHLRKEQISKKGGRKRLKRQR